MEQSINPSRVHINSMSVGQSSGVGASSFYYDGSRGEGGDNGSEGNNDRGNVGRQDQSQHPLSSFTNEVGFTHCT